LKGWDPNNTQINVTILDAAEDAALFAELDPNPWDKCIPGGAVWIDNYVTAFGDVHPEAANVILEKGMPVTVTPTLIGLFYSFINFHSYAVDWYIESIKNPSWSQMGFQWSFESGGLNGAPGAGSTFRQTSNPSDSELNLESITLGEGIADIRQRNVLFTAEPGFFSLELVQGPIEALGIVQAGVQSKIVNNLFLYTLNLTLTEGSPSYAWVPVFIPINSEFMSFNFKVEQLGDGDFLSVGIQDELLFMLEIENSSVLQTANSGFLNISEYAGNEVELFFGLNSVGSSNAKISIENITFYSRLFGDTEKDGDVDGTDLAAMIQSFGSVAGQANYHSVKDLNGDGVIDQDDIPIFSEKLGYVK
jgi:hypothetical protein